MFSGVGGVLHNHTTEPVVDPQVAAHNTVGLVPGLILTLTSTMMFSFNYVLSENILTAPQAPFPTQLQTYTGTICAILVTTYLGFWTLPNFGSVVVDKVAENGGSWPVIVFVYIILILSAFGHSVTFYHLMGSIGAVSTGILQSLRAVSVFAMSALFFCDSHENQCFNQYKGVSTILVVVGILLFSKVSATSSSKKGLIAETVDGEKSYSHP